MEHDIVALASDSPSILLISSCNNWLILLSIFNDKHGTLMAKLNKLIECLQSMEELDTNELDNPFLAENLEKLLDETRLVSLAPITIPSI